MITVYSKSNCPQCDQAKAILKSNCIEFEVIMVDQEPAAMSFLKSAGHKSVPQLYENGSIYVDGIVGLKKKFV